MNKYRKAVLKTFALLIGALALVIGYMKYGIELPLIIALSLLSHNISKHYTLK